MLSTVIGLFSRIKEDTVCYAINHPLREIVTVMASTELQSKKLIYRTITGRKNVKVKQNNNTLEVCYYQANYSFWHRIHSTA